MLMRGTEVSELTYQDDTAVSSGDHILASELFHMYSRMNEESTMDQTLDPTSFHRNNNNESVSLVESKYNDI